jgi:hypothetical protein
MNGMKKEALIEKIEKGQTQVDRLTRYLQDDRIQKNIEEKIVKITLSLSRKQLRYNSL